MWDKWEVLKAARSEDTLSSQEQNLGRWKPPLKITMTLKRLKKKKRLKSMERILPP